MALLTRGALRDALLSTGAAILFSLVVSCGDGTPPAAPSTPENPNQVVITEAGAVSPAEIVVSPGSRVLFVNRHSRRHHVASDPHPEHTQCTEINAVGVLQPGERRETGNLVALRTCAFHDHEDPENGALKGRIVIR